MGKIEKFNNESDLLQRIDQLKQEGANEGDLQVISEHKLDDNSLDYTDVKFKNSRGSFSDKITALFSGESAEERVLSGLNVPDEKLEEYRNDLNEGKILLYVDNDNNDQTENYDSGHPKDSQSGNEHYDNTKPFSNDESKNNGVAEGAGAGAVGAGAASAANKDETKEPNDFDASNSNDNDTQEQDLTKESSLNNQEDVTDDTNRYGNAIDDENNAHDDVDDKSTAAGLAGASGLGAAGYASQQGEKENNQDVYTNDNERDLETLDNRDKAEPTSRVSETDNVQDQEDLTRENESEFTRVHDDNVESERSSLNYNRNDDALGRNDEVTNNETLNTHSTSDEPANRNEQTDEEAVKLHEERVHVNKENVETGEASIDKHVVEEEKEFDVPVEREEVTIERRPVNEKVDSDFDSNQDDSVHIPLHEERVNVNKENVVSEEIVVKKNKVQDTEHISEKVRREEADIDNPTDNTDK
ncbi:DUF2382 domain-containing protein [Mammaliicoccus stepanovicii]|uniref:Transcriptional regulator n=1 Tax=Mammaliicoccus stepanovicii TaxID=643214 RepID=A0A240AEU4_9STAP|nr:DUF2382 domain-containing protein [Mammaliicoccus stepanovicii]PNZ77741.1 DUF2382 domain-containing protein [Mammaliicoccus stepanovicii]GGI42813.1 hypothetical protein GCM10010896_20280 [Mammaliicoccus stepanovicii]SNV81614.1 transcriptional regulator [Mammaliicoccus stepanovicii]